MLSLSTLCRPSEHLLTLRFVSMQDTWPARPPCTQAVISPHITYSPQRQTMTRNYNVVYVAPSTFSSTVWWLQSNLETPLYLHPPQSGAVACNERCGILYQQVPSIVTATYSTSQALPPLPTQTDPISCPSKVTHKEERGKERN